MYKISDTKIHIIFIVLFL